MGNSLLSHCCAPPRTPKEEDTSAIATNRVELAASELFSLPGLATAYHTSVLVNGEEFFFSDSGIFSNRMLASHQGSPSERVEMGYSSRTGSQLLSVLQPHFRPGSYDLVRKNCNSFSDSALCYLLRGERLERKYNAMERLGQGNVELLRQVTSGMYTPNPVSEGFQVDTVIEAVSNLKDEDNKEGAAKAYAQSRSRPALFHGVQVTIIGLTNALNLNGEGAVIVRYNAVNGRWEAKLNSTNEVKAFRAENLRPAGELALEPGNIVRVHGLTSEVGQALNGQEGEVISYNHTTSRYEIRLADETKALKAENLQAV